MSEQHRIRQFQKGAIQMNSIFGLAGAGGFGRTVMPLARAAKLATEQLYFVEAEKIEDEINGTKCLSEQDFLNAPENKNFNVAISDSTLRAKIVKKYKDAGAKPKMIACDSVRIFDDVEIGEGAILCSHTMLTSNIRIGKFFHANIYSYVEHDCVIGDYVTFAPGVKCNGNVVIGDHCYVGAGAIFRDGRRGKPLRIGEYAVIGMGAVVVDDVPAGAIVAGNPARPLKRGRMYNSRAGVDANIMNR
jgi:sugar O-acyltransferase (sialic acid O-acetyltransferase NeuD family)